MTVTIHHRQNPLKFIMNAREQMEDRNLFTCFLNLVRDAIGPADCRTWHTHRVTYPWPTIVRLHASRQRCLRSVFFTKPTHVDCIFTSYISLCNRNSQDLYDGHSKAIHGLFRRHSAPSVGRNEITNCCAYLLTYSSHHLTLILLTWRIGWAHNNARK